MENEQINLVMPFVQLENHSRMAHNRLSSEQLNLHISNAFSVANKQHDGTGSSKTKLRDPSGLRKQMRSQASKKTSS